jgi:tetratricopeptide (TPR) repeat protein
MLAEIEAAAGNRAAAIARYRAVLAFDRANLVALNNAAYQLVLETPDAALPLAQKAAEIAPDNPAVQDTLGWVYYRKGIYRSAIGALSAAVAKEPTPRRRFHLAMSYIRAGDGEIGRKLLQAALQQDPRLSATEQGW